MSSPTDQPREETGDDVVKEVVRQIDEEEGPPE